MSYAIGHVILGIDFSHSEYSNTPDPWADHREELEPLINGRYDRGISTEPTEGFGSAYSGSDGNPEWFGLTLGQFDECNGMTGDEMIALCTLPQNKMLEYFTLVSTVNANPDISDELKLAITSAKARVHIIWGSS